MGSSISLSVKQAKRLVLASQGVHCKATFGKGDTRVPDAIKQLSYVQIDTISVVQRAHHHTLWNRVRNYDTTLLDQAVKQQKVFEYWSHAAAYLPMSDYRYSLPRKTAIANGERHWYKKDAKQAKFVLDRIRSEGPLQASAFTQARSIKRTGWGDLKPAKLALEQLFMEGELMISRRQGFQKVFDLTERVVPNGIDSSMPSEEEFSDHLIMRYLSANSLGTAAEIAYLRKGLKASIQTRCLQLVENGELQQIDVAGKMYFAKQGFDELLKIRQSRTAIRILSPFDNLLIQRARMRDLFNFDYQIECYVPAAKRKFGYFALPLLAGQDFIGRLDAKADRKTGEFHLLNLALESCDFTEQLPQLSLALSDFMRFNGSSSITLKQASLNGKRLLKRDLAGLVSEAVIK